jgi:GT2 family glycosyltransferase
MSRSAFLDRLFAQLLTLFRGPAPPAQVRLAIDLPEPDSASGGTLVIRGWAFSRGRRIVDVQATLGGGAPHALSYGFRRPDVAVGFAAPEAARCGFQGTLTFEPVDTDRTERLVVRATDESGDIGEAHVAVRVVTPGKLWSEGRRVHGTRSIAPDPHGGLANASREILVRIQEAVGRIREDAEHEPAILDWHSGLPLAATFPDLAVFSPPDEGITLPYLDHTLDIVVVDAENPSRVADAQRVAALAVIEIRTGSAKDPSVERATLSWQRDAPSQPSLPVASIIIPVHDQVKHTDACLTQVIATLPAGFRGEILVVDDASTDETRGVLGRWAESCPLVRVLRNDENVGFLQSCNRGAEAATGEILVFLNNDTLPKPGWLPPMIRLLQDEPSAGAVGGKLLYPDGTLQEAGGVIFSDGSGCNFGKRDPYPNAPLFNFVREVDYCSGALLAIRRTVFLEMDGFDRLFSPAYYEDTDLCFRLREKGYCVYYQPEATVVHVEGATSGTDTDAGVKRYQTVNREKFVDRWRTALANQPAAPAKLDTAVRYALARRRRPRRALVCAPRMPEYDRESGSQRTLHLIEFLQASGWAVSFLATDSMAGERYVRLLQQRGVATYAGPDSLEAGDEYLPDLDELIAKDRFDLAVLAFWHVAERLLPRLRWLSPSTRVIVDSVDLHFLRSARRALHRSPGRERGTLDDDFADQMTREMNTYAAADAVLTVSQKEADLINDMAADSGLASCVADMEELGRSPLEFEERRGLLFIGNFRHAPNLEALEYLCTQILPRLDPALLAAHPLCVVGNELDERVRAVAGGMENVRLVGWVPSLRPYLERARVSVIPLLHGAGTKRKLIQALMVGTPSVSTRIGIEGLGLDEGDHVLVGDTPEEFAAQLRRLIEDPVIWGRLATEGRAHIERTHGRTAVQARFHSVVERVISRP